MRVLIINTDYPDFLNTFYREHSGLEYTSYDCQMSARNKSLFGTADFYSTNFRRLGHEAWDIHVNNLFLQRAWAKEHNIALSPPSKLTRGTRILKYQTARAVRDPYGCLKRMLNISKESTDISEDMFYNILSHQIKYYKPDVILNQDVSRVGTDFLKAIKPNVKLLIGQHSSYCNFRKKEFDCYDLIISSFPPTLQYFRQNGIPAELNQLGFDQRILMDTNPSPKVIDVSFVGSLYNVHSSRTKWLEYLCERFPQIKVWGPSIDNLPIDSFIRKRYIGQAWGREMYQIIRDSKITLNFHGDHIPCAANMRLYEATGMGSLLITDWKSNLNEIFEIGKEIIAYHDVEECAELVQYYLNQKEEREIVACAGQKRTLKEHTYYHRAQQIIDIINRKIG